MRISILAYNAYSNNVLALSTHLGSICLTNESLQKNSVLKNDALEIVSLGKGSNQPLELIIKSPPMFVSDCLLWIWCSHLKHRYGITFSTHVMGTPTILSSDVELTKTVYQQTNKLFQLALPSTTHSILGNESLFFMKADIHKKVRNLIKGPFSARELESFIPTIDKTCQNALASWKGQKQIRVYHEAKKVTTS